MCMGGAGTQQSSVRARCLGARFTLARRLLAGGPPPSGVCPPQGRGHVFAGRAALPLLAAHNSRVTFLAVPSPGVVYDGYRLVVLVVVVVVAVVAAAAVVDEPVQPSISPSPGSLTFPEPHPSLPIFDPPLDPPLDLPLDPPN